MIDDDGVHRYTVLAKAHLADCGNAVPTTYVADATDVYNEGASDLPVREGAGGLSGPRRRACAWPASASASPTSGTATTSRCSVPPGSANAGCSSSSTRMGERLAQAAYERDWFDYSEQRMIAAIRRLPAGTVTRDGRHDPIPGMPDGVPVKVTVTVDPDEARDRGRSPRQPRLPAMRPQPHRGDVENRRDDGRLHRARDRRAPERRRVPPVDGAPARELRRRHPAAPRQLLGRDDRPLRADRRGSSRSLSATSAKGSAWPRSDERNRPSMSVISGTDPRHDERRRSSTSSSSR